MPPHQQARNMQKPNSRNSNLTSIALPLAVLAGGFIASSCLAASAVVAQQAGAPPETDQCTLSKRSGPHAVVSVIDGATILLDSGEHVRLVGLLAPSVFDASPGRKATERLRTTSHLDVTSWGPANAAKEALAKLALGRPVTLAYTGRRRDRYGRHLAHVFAKMADKNVVWLQGAMLTAGHARAVGFPDNFGCIDALLAAEDAARTAMRGIWSNPVYTVRPAWQSRALLQRRGTFQLVEGRIKNAARARGGRIYLNFGSNWRRDFSAMVAPGVSRSNPAWASSLLDLAGRDVQLRGWVLQRNGPMLDIEHPSQITILEKEPDTVRRKTNSLQQGNASEAGGPLKAGR